MKLKGQVVLVTGGGSGAGEAIVAACVAEGAQVVAMGRGHPGSHDGSHGRWGRYVPPKGRRQLHPDLHREGA